MQFPNKLYCYKNSTLSLIPLVLKEIKRGHTSVIDLFQKVSPALTDPTDFLSVMDCLYALHAIEMDDNGEVNICL